MAQYFNGITKELDNYLVYSNKPYCFDTYITDYAEGIWVIRFPGATRGYIRVDDDMIITEIELYNDTAFDNKIGCYKRDVLSILNKFIGTKLELLEEEM